jgi:2-isopropylmalate synthase
MFWKEYIERDKPWWLHSFETVGRDGVVSCKAILLCLGEKVEIEGKGNGPIAALVHAFSNLKGSQPIPVHPPLAGGSHTTKFEITYYSEHALSSGEGAAAISYIQIKTTDGKTRWGAGVDTNIELASVKAVLSALNRV